MTTRGRLPSKPENFKISFLKSTLQTPCFFTKVFYFFLHQYGPREVQKAKNHIQKRLPSWSKSSFYDFAENPIFGQTSQLLPNFFMACYWTYTGCSAKNWTLLGGCSSAGDPATTPVIISSDAESPGASFEGRRDKVRRLLTALSRFF